MKYKRRVTLLREENLHNLQLTHEWHHMIFKRALTRCVFSSMDNKGGVGT